MSEQSRRPVGKVLAIAVRSSVNGPMREIERAEASEGSGLEGDVAVKPHRGVTFISSEQWQEVCTELGAELPWHTRRANILVDAPHLEHLIGKSVTLGTASVQINAETKPCGLMDQLHRGLRERLTPSCRGGVYGQVTESGGFAVGDMVIVEE